MVEIENTLGLVAQQIPPQLEYLLRMFFLTGLVIGIAVTFIIAGLWSRDKRRIEREATAAGVSLNMESGKVGYDHYGIEGCGYCIGFIIIIAAGALGVSLPQVLPEATEDLIGMIFVIIFGSAFWGLVLGSIPYVRSYRRGFRKALQDATDNQSESKM